MTEALSRLLHDAATDLRVPPPPAVDVLAEGRRRRNRGRTTLAGGVASLAVAGVVGAVLLVPGGADDGDRGVDTAAASGQPSFTGVTWALGSEVFLDGGDEVVEIDDGAVKSIYYSSAGIVVRHGDNSFSDGGGPQRFTLVRPDGTTSPISVATEETPPGVDVDQPLLAWAEAVPGGIEVVVHDVDTDAEVARVPVDGEFSWSPPPVALDGDTVYVGGRNENSPELLAVNWRTETVADSGVRAYFPEVAGGNAIAGGANGPGDSDVLDVATGGTEYYANVDLLRLSPDGRFASGFSYPDEATTPPVQVVEVEGGASEPELREPIAFDRELTGQVGWSAASQPFSIDGDTLTACSTTTATCETRTVDLDAEDFPLLGGAIYES